MQQLQLNTYHAAAAFTACKRTTTSVPEKWPWTLEILEELQGRLFWWFNKHDPFTPETNSELSEHPENGWVGTPLVSFFGMAYVQGWDVSFRDGKCEDSMEKSFKGYGTWLCLPSLKRRANVTENRSGLKRNFPSTISWGACEGVYVLLAGRGDVSSLGNRFGWPKGTKNNSTGWATTKLVANGVIIPTWKGGYNSTSPFIFGHL